MSAASSTFLVKWFSSPSAPPGSHPAASPTHADAQRGLSDRQSPPPSQNRSRRHPTTRSHQPQPSPLRSTQTLTHRSSDSPPADSTPNDEEPDFVGIERFRFMDTSGVLGSWQQCLSGRVWCSVWRNRAAIAKRMAERDAHCGGPRDRIMVDRFQWFARRGTPHVAGERGYQPAWQLM